MTRIKENLTYTKVPALIYFCFLFVGTVIGFLFIHPQAEGGVSDLSKISADNFWKIFFNNALIIVVIYFSALFTKMVAWTIYAMNGIRHGIVLGWIIRYDLHLIALMLPHGFFEIPCILLTGIIVQRGKALSRERPMQFFKYLILHILSIGFCAFIEAFVTPAFSDAIR